MLFVVVFVCLLSVMMLKLGLLFAVVFFGVFSRVVACCCVCYSVC